MITRRAHLQSLFGVAATAAMPLSARAQDKPVPPEGIGHRIKHLSYSDVGGRPDGVQVMVNRGHVYYGHMFSDGVTILDASNPRTLKPVGFFTAGQYTRTHHLQVADDLMLLANGANIVAMQSYDNQRGYFENALVDSISNRKKFRSGLSIHDISKPGQMREIAFLEIPGFGVNRLSWMGGRYAYLSAHFDGFTDHIFCIVDLQNITKPEIVSRWWLPGMHRAGGEKSTVPQGKRVALHHAIIAGDRAFGAWRDGGLTIHDFRHTASTNFRRAGVDTMTAMRIVGHKSEKMHRRYNQITPEDLHGAALKLGQYKATNTLITPGVQVVGGDNVSHCEIRVGA